jgi:GH35 family endo-1,4-beta-xylanase
MKTRSLLQLSAICALFLTVDLFAQDLQDWGEYENTKQEAIERIEQHRKGAVELQIVLPNGEVADSVPVTIELKRHDFLWGAVTNGRNFANSAYVDKYKEMYLKYFNAAGIENGLKPKQRNGFGERSAEVAFDWFRKNDFYMRGHTLTWEGYNWSRPEDRAVYDDSTLSDSEKAEKIIESYSRHFHHAIPKWDVQCWDVSNEPIDNNSVNDLLPEQNTHAHWFKLADSVRKEHSKEDVLLFQNQYQIVSGTSNNALTLTKEGYESVGRMALYAEMMDEQIAAGAPIEGIGFQSRLRAEWPLITPDVIYDRLCYFDRFDLPYHATEFELRDGGGVKYTEEQRRILTEYMMVMYFSHPKVEGFWHWTFAGGRDYSLFNRNGTPTINGKIWIDLMEGFFNTILNTEASRSGKVGVKGYYGTYEVTAEVDGKQLQGAFSISKSDSKPTIEVVLK